MYQIKNGLAPDNITEIFDTRNKKYNLRNSNFVIPRFESIKTRETFTEIHRTLSTYGRN